MNLSLSDEQVFLREAARGALSRFKTLEAAREALDGDRRPARPLADGLEAGWPGLLIDEEHGGAGLDVFDAMLVLGECGRVLAGVPLLGHLPATAILNAAGDAPSSAARERRAASGLPALLARPSDLGAAGRSTRRGCSARRRRRGAPRTGDAADRQRQLRVGARCPRRRPARRRRADLDGTPVGVAIDGRRRRRQIEPVHALRRDAHARARHARRRPGDGPGASDAEALAAMLVSRAGADRRRVARQRRDGAGRVASPTPRSGTPSAARSAPTRPSSTASPRCCASWRTGARCCYYAGWARQGAPGRVPARGQRRAHRRGARARLRRAHDDLRARRHRRDLGARRAAVLPPRAALAPAARRHRRRHRPRRRRAAARGRRGRRRALGAAPRRSLRVRSRAAARPPARRVCARLAVRALACRARRLLRLQRGEHGRAVRAVTASTSPCRRRS